MYKKSKKKRILASIVVLIVLVAMVVTGILSALLIEYRKQKGEHI